MDLQARVLFTAPRVTSLSATPPAEPRPQVSPLSVCLGSETEEARGVQPKNSALIFTGTELFSRLEG